MPYAPQHERVTGPVKIFEIDEKPSNEPEIEDSNVDENGSKSPDNEVVEDANTTSDDDKTS